jgi:hypothetical protein
MPNDKIILNSSIETCIKLLNNQNTSIKYIESAEDILNDANLSVKTEGLLLLLLRIINSDKLPKDNYNNNYLQGGDNYNRNLVILSENITYEHLNDALNNFENFSNVTNNANNFHKPQIILKGGDPAYWMVEAMNKIQDKLMNVATPVIEEAAIKVIDQGIRHAGPLNVIKYSLEMIAESVKVAAIDNAELVLKKMSSHPVVTAGVGVVVVGVALYAMTYKNEKK